MAGEDERELSERATPRRLQEARDRGQVPRSREFNVALMMVAGSAGLALLGRKMVDGLLALMQSGLSPARADLYSDPALFTALSGASFTAIGVIAPFLILTLAVAVIGPAAIGGWVFYPGAVTCNWERLDPLKGLSRIFAWHGLLELFKSVVKFALIACVAAAFLWHSALRLLDLVTEPLAAGLAGAAEMASWAFVACAAACLPVALIDVPFQIWDHARQLRMSRHDLREEIKETEGRPEVKGRIRRLQHEFTRARMMAAVPRADVVVANPSHYAVALRYDQHKHRAPKVVARGVELIAIEIRRRAWASGVPIISAPPLARALYHATRLGGEVPAGLYLAVARVLAYVFQLRTPRAQAARIRVPTDAELPIPAELRA